jgi:hypothetical protein
MKRLYGGFDTIGNFMPTTAASNTREVWNRVRKEVGLASVSTKDLKSLGYRVRQHGTLAG